MNRQTLAEATSLHDGPVPIYLMEEIAAGVRSGHRDAEKIADFLLGRLSKSNLNVKLKALQIITYCAREGSPAFIAAVRDDEQDIAAYLQCTGPPDPVYGDEKYRRIRVASQEALVCLNDGSLSRSNAEPPKQQPSGGPGGGWQQPLQGNAGPSYGQPQAPSYGQPQAPSYGDNGPSYDNRQQYGHNDAQSSSGPWGNTNTSNVGGPRPAPYRDGSSSSGPSYGGHQQAGGYNGPSYGGNSSYGQSPNDQGGYGHQQSGGPSAGGYGNSQSQGYNHNEPQASGFNSWSNNAAPVAPPAAPAAAAPAASGIWSSSGYQKKDLTQDPTFNAPRYSRDNRPTVLVGHKLNFSKPVGVGGGYNGNSGGFNGNSGSFNPPNVGGYGNSSQGGGFNGNSGGFNPPNASGFGNSSSNRFSSSSGGGGFSSQQQRGVPSYVENMNRMLSNPGSIGHSGNNVQQFSDLSQSKLGKTVVGLKKIGIEAKDRWDRRNMDKSMGSSLADHDELRAGPQVVERGYQYQPQQGTGGSDTSLDYERGMIDNLCASVGLARAPPPDALARFVDLAQTLNSETIGDILLDKLEDPAWQVRLKALHVVLALLESPNADPYFVWFEENVDVLEALRTDAKPSVSSKAVQVLRVMGFADETAAPKPQVAKRPTASRSVSADYQAPPPAQAQARGAEEIDFLGLESLSINPQPVAAPQAVAPILDIYGSPAPAPQVPAPVQQKEISLLDGFDPIDNGSYAPQQQQQQYGTQQQYYQPQQAQPLVQQQQYPPQQQQQYAQQQHTPPQQPNLFENLQTAGAPPMDDRSKTLSHLGKDLFTIANSPRSSVGEGQPKSEQSAFNFM